MFSLLYSGILNYLRGLKMNIEISEAIGEGVKTVSEYARFLKIKSGKYIDKSKVDAQIRERLKNDKR